MLILETPRLALRQLAPADLDDLYALYRDPDVRRYFPNGTLDRRQTQDELEWFINGHPARPELGLWATMHKASGRFIGRCGLLPWTIAGRDEVEVAYLIAPEFQGQGLATEAARALVDHGFGRLRLRRLICMMYPANAASVKVATKIGMRMEREMEDEEGKFLLYARDHEADGQVGVPIART